MTRETDSLRATRDPRTVMKAVARDHLKVTNQEVETAIFPNSSGAQTLSGLFG